MKNLIVAIVFWWSGLQHKVIARLLWLGLWAVFTFDFAWFIFQLKPGDYTGLKFVAALLAYFFLTDIILGVLYLLYGSKEYRFLGGIFIVEVEDGWMAQAI